jgi:anti-sigma B factor antagonist
MDSKQSDYPKATVFHLAGRLDATHVGQLERQVIGCLDGGAKNLIFDFAALDYINSAGLRILVLSYQRLQPQGGQVFVCGAKDYIVEIFDISGYNRIFPMLPDLDRAMAALT